MNELTARLLDEASEALVALSTEGTVLAWNRGAETLFGTAAREAIGRPWQACAVSGSEPLWADQLDRSLREQTVTWRAVCRGPDGEPQPVDGSFRLVADGADRWIAVVARRAGEQRSAGAQTNPPHVRTSDILASISHDLRTPLNAVIGFAELMYDGKVGPLSAEQHEYLGDIVASSRHLLGMIRHIVELAKLESDAITFRPRPVDVQRLADDVVEGLRGRIASKRLRLTLHVAPEIGPVVIDPERVRQILDNYLTSAVERLPLEDSIDVRIAGEDARFFRIEVEHAAVVVEDAMDGLGDAFHQQRSASSAKVGGASLGLAVSRRLAEAMRGRIEVRSAAGTTNVLAAILPRSPEAAGASSGDSRT